MHTMFFLILKRNRLVLNTIKDMQGEGNQFNWICLYTIEKKKKKNRSNVEWTNVKLCRPQVEEFNGFDVKWGPEIRSPFRFF